MDNKESKKKFLHADLKKPHYYGVRDGIHLFHGSHEDHKQHIGKHLTNPSDEDLNRGLEEAKEKGLHSVYIHGAPPHSLRSKIHPELGSHVPGTLGKSEDLAKMAAKAKKIVEGEQSKGSVQSQYWVKYPGSDTGRKGKYAKYEMHASDAKHLLDNYDKHAHHVLAQKYENRPEAKNSGAHATAITREKNGVFTPSEPIADHVAKGAGTGKRILYFGCGHDFGGALALAGGNAKLERELMRDKDGNKILNDKGVPYYHNHKIVGGDNQVDLYDKFHHDKSITQLPSGKYDEVHSHYVFNVIDHATGKEALGQLHSKLKPQGKAIITVRRDKGMKTNSDWEKLNSANKEMAERKEPTPKVGMKTKLNKGEPKKYPAKKKPKEAPQASTHFSLSDLHNAVREHCKSFGHEGPPDEAFAPKKVARLEPVPVKKSELLSQAKVALHKIQEEVVTLTTRELTKGMAFPESKCDACGCKVEGCLCFEGFSEPEFTFDGKKLSILFKSDWDEESKESYVDDFKRRAGRLIKK